MGFCGNLFYVGLIQGPVFKHEHELYVDLVTRSVLKHDNDRAVALLAVGCVSQSVMKGYNNNNNNIFYIAPQQQLYELLALYRSTNAIKHTSTCYLISLKQRFKQINSVCLYIFQCTHI